MQHSPEDIKRKLLACIDEDSNVTDMATCLGIIGVLEQTAITRKILEDTRLGKYVNDIRRKSGDQELSKRLKNLVRKWRDACQAEPVNGVPPKGPGPGSTSNGRQSISPPFSAPSSIRGHGGLSPYSLPSSGNTSPILGAISAPTTPSTLPQQSQTISPVLSIRRSNIHKHKITSPCITHRSPVISPLPAPISPSPCVNPPLVTIKDEPNYTPSLENVPRTNAANKRRRRKEDDRSSEIPSSKRLKGSLSNGFDEDCSRDSFCSIISNDRISRTSGDGSAVQEIPQKKPLTRRSGRRKKNQEPQCSNTSSVAPDPLRQKMAVIGAKSHKVKTTSQLVAELAERKGDVHLAKRASILGQGKERENEQSPLRPDHETVTINKMKHMEKFLKSQPDPIVIDDDEEDDDVHIDENDDDEDEEPNSRPISTETNSSDSSVVPIPICIPHRPDSPTSNMDLLGIKENESAEEILARLPPVDIGLIEWDSDNPEEDSELIEDSGDELEQVDRLVERSKCVDNMLVQTLHTTNVECQNGNFDMDGRFREWHEVIFQKAYQDTPLVVLPYVMTDF